MTNLHDDLPRFFGSPAHPALVTACGPLSDEIDKIRRLEDVGVSAVVLYSLFEEQLRLETYELTTI